MEEITSDAAKLFLKSDDTAELSEPQGLNGVRDIATEYQLYHDLEGVRSFKNRSDNDARMFAEDIGDSLDRITLSP